MATTATATATKNQAKTDTPNEIRTKQTKSERASDRTSEREGESLRKTSTNQNDVLVPFSALLSTTTTSMYIETYLQKSERAQIGSERDRRHNFCALFV